MSRAEDVCRGGYLRCLGSKVSAAAATFDVSGRRCLKIQALDAYLRDRGFLGVRCLAAGLGRDEGF